MTRRKTKCYWNKVRDDFVLLKSLTLAQHHLQKVFWYIRKKPQAINILKGDINYKVACLFQVQRE